MGNCVFKGLGGGGGEADHEEIIKVITSNGGVMELYPPITAESITNEFPGHLIYRKTRNDIFSSQPLLHNQELQAGQLYYLLPSSSSPPSSSSSSLSSTGGGAPYRMSLDNHKPYKRSSLDHKHHEVFPRYNSSTCGVWKVKLVISTEQLAEILSQETRTEALIESVRTVAKCGKGGVVSSSSMADSDQWSVSGGGSVKGFSE